MSFPYFLDLSFRSEQSCADNIGRISFGSSSGEEGGDGDDGSKCTIVDTSECAEPWCMILSLTPDLEEGSVVRVSGTLTPDTDTGVEPMILDNEEYEVQKDLSVSMGRVFSTAIAIMTTGSPSYWLGWENLTVTIVE